MCGIAGVISFNSVVSNSVLDEMIYTLKHRGPDYQRVLKTKMQGVHIGLAHARLSVIDLSIEAAQPFRFEHLVITYNGELYNYKEIRRTLENLGQKFRTNSDTEVIIQAFAFWGHDAVQKFNGMYAFAIVDEKAERVYFYRDHVGIKPLYYFWDNENFIFGSELKAIVKHPGFKRVLSPIGLAQYFKQGFIPTPLTIYMDTFKVDPATYLTLDIKTKTIKTERYWNSTSYFQLPKFDIPYSNAKSKLKQLLRSSCISNTIADVGFGVFLSGGYDSTAVASILQESNMNKIKTFTIGFEEGNNEAPYAKETAHMLGTNHTEYVCQVKDAQNIIPELAYYHDEPFADSSSIPTMLVSKIAKKDVTVALSADGGDEIFAGYNRYTSFNKNMKLLNKYGWMNNAPFSNILKASAGILRSESFLKHRLDYFTYILKIDKEYRGGKLFEDSMGLPKHIFNSLLVDLTYPNSLTDYSELAFSDKLSIAQAIDFNNYLPNNILSKVDRMSMSTSLEARVPLLNKSLFEFVAQLPTNYKYDGISNKKILKDIVHAYIPKEKMLRPKTGFTIPIANWLRSDLSYLLDDYLRPERLNETGIFNVSYVTHLVHLFNEKQLHSESIIWRILQFQLWFEKWMK